MTNISWPRGIATVVIVRSSGHDELTERIIVELEDSSIPYGVLVVDNYGSFRAPEFEHIQVFRPGRDLGWARGSNVGMRVALADHQVDTVVLLDNDVRLSRNFLGGLDESRKATGAKLVAPVGDHNGPQQCVEFRGSPAEYQPVVVDTPVPFVDVAAMLIPRSTVEAVGFLDEENWPRWGQGCGTDYALRVRASGGSVVVTKRAYLARVPGGKPGSSESAAETEIDEGMRRKWGRDWRERLYAGFDETPPFGMLQQAVQSGDGGVEDTDRM